MMKSNLSVAYNSSKFNIYPVLFTNMMLSTLLILAVCTRRVVYELRNGLAHQSLWLRGRASERGICSSWGLRIVSFVPRLWQNKEIFLYFFTELKIDYLSKSITGGFGSLKLS